MEEDNKPRKFADRIALQQARQAEIDSAVQQMKELEIVAPSNPRRFMDRIALQKQRQDDLQKILASVSPSAATLGNDFDTSLGSSNSSGQQASGAGAGTRSTPTPTAAQPYRNDRGPPSPYWPEPPYDPSAYSAPRQGEHTRLDQPVVYANPSSTGSSTYHAGEYGGPQGDARYGYYQAPAISHTRSTPQMTFGPYSDGHEGYNVGSPYDGSSRYHGGPHITVAADTGFSRYASSPGLGDQSPEPPKSASSFTIDSLLAPSSAPSAQNQLAARRERGGSVRVKRQAAIEDPFANRRATSMRIKKTSSRQRNRSLDAAMGDLPPPGLDSGQHSPSPYSPAQHPYSPGQPYSPVAQPYSPAAQAYSPAGHPYSPGGSQAYRGAQRSAFNFYSAPHLGGDSGGGGGGAGSPYQSGR